MGPGVLAFARYNHWHGSPWHYIVDGRDYVVRETSTANPNKPVANSIFLPQEQFPSPLTWTWSDTKGADLTWVPLSFERSFTMAYERTHYGTGYYIYHKLMPGLKNLSQPIRTWSFEQVPPRDVLELIAKSGTDIAPSGDRVTALSGRLRLRAEETKTCFAISEAPSMIRALTFTIDQAQAPAFSQAWLRLYWDGTPVPSVNAPIKLLFGAGTLYNRDNREYLVKAFPVNIRFIAGKVHFAMYFPMPFMRNVRLELVESQGSAIEDLGWSVRYEPYTEPANWVCNLHATYVDHKEPVPGEDLVFLDTRRVEGGGDWCGHIVGTSFIFSHRGVLATLEGDPRFFFDDSNTPQVQGTGTEEWAGGGDYWGGRTMTLPFVGHPVGCRSPKQARNEQDLIQSAYRFLLSDLMPFGKNARVQFEHGGENNSTEHYESVTFWYGLHQPSLNLTDVLNVGDPDDERRHKYASPTASPVQKLSSRYEWGVDHLDDKEIYPETADVGRYMTGVSTFTLKLLRGNLGVLLRRKMDYSFPNQCAKVYVADDRPDADFHEVGLWYAAGSNTVVYSNPREEVGPTEHIVQTSNRRWRDDEFLLPRSLTQGRSSIRVKIEFVRRDIPLYPGHPIPKQAWSEYRYTAYCYVMPRV